MQDDHQGACTTATYLVDRGDPPGAAPLGERAPLTELLKAVCQSYGRRCARDDRA